MIAQSPSCELCRYDMPGDETPPVTHESAGIGALCSECAAHATVAGLALHATPGIAPHPLPDHVNRNAKKKPNQKIK